MNKTKFFIIITVLSSILFVLFLLTNKLTNISIKDLKRNDYIKNEFIQKDSLKLSSLNFLLENSDDKYSLGRIGNRKYDSINIDKDYLLENIDLAITQGKERINEGMYTTNQFLQYVLPYRLRYEKTENWRKLAIKNYENCYHDDILKHVECINSKLMVEFKYTGRDIKNRKLSSMIQECNGGCLTMSDLAAFTMRANGIPVAIDFAKWSNIKGKHQWNSLILKDKSIPFLGAESNPNVNDPININVTDYFKKFAKVYRKTFIKDSYDGDFNPKRLISDENYLDVTNEYCVNSQDLNLKFSNENIENELFYLCVYEVNDWTPIDFSFGKEGVVNFKNICPNNIFVLKKKVKNKLEYYKHPFIFKDSGKITFLTSDINISGDLTLHFTNSNERELIRLFGIPMEEKEFKLKRNKILEENYTGIVVKDTLYTLFKWENKWVKLEQSIANDSTVIFNTNSKNAIYKLESNNSKSKNNRCFTYDGKNQNWW